MRRRRNSGKNVNEFVNENLKGKIGTLMDNRRRLLAPFPVAAEQIYRMAWTAEERAAIRVCAKRKELFRMGSTLIVKMPIKLQDKSEVVGVSIKLAQELPMPGYSLEVPFQQLMLAQADALQEWAPRWIALRQEQNRLLTRLEQCGKVCRTFGQLYRLWPDILSFFNEVGAQKVREARVRSAYPDAVMLFDGAKSLRPEWSLETFAPFTSMIAECLMLPECDAKEVATIAGV